MERAEHRLWTSQEVSRLLALVEAERSYYQGVFAALPVAVAAVNGALEIVAVNRAFRKRFGCEPGETGSLRLGTVIPGEELAGAVKQTLETGQASTVKLGPMRVSVQKSSGWQAEAEDEALLTFLEAEAAEAGLTGAEARALAEEAKRCALERLSGRLAHVANNLLMIIGGYADELIESLPEDDERRGDVQEIVAASRRLGALTKDLTLLTRPAHFEAIDFELGPVLEEMAARIAGAECGHVESGLRATASPPLLERIVVEAQTYLKPHLGPEARLVLGAAAHGEERLCVELSAPGAAIPEEVRERIFEPFSGEKEGTDPRLGLAGLVRPWMNLGGTIEFGGEPARLRLTCPRAAAATAPEPEPAATVLVVEDEPGIKSLIVKVLARQGYRLLEAGEPAEALALAAKEARAADVLITDLMMPGMNGRDLAERVREMWPETRILFISAYTNDAELAAQIASGRLGARTRFLAKPFTVGQLVDEVKGLLG